MARIRPTVTVDEDDHGCQDGRAVRFVQFPSRVASNAIEKKEASVRQRESEAEGEKKYKPDRIGIARCSRIGTVGAARADTIASVKIPRRGGDT